MSKKNLIVYFSRKGKNYVGGDIVDLSVGNTEIMAQIIGNLTDGDLFRIDPVKEYSPDYNNCADEAKDELRRNARPEIKSYPKNIDEYDTIILGYPNWWSTMPMPVWTFLERFDLSGKTILPFCTHEGSGMGRSETDIQNLCSGVSVKKGLAIRGSGVKIAESTIAAWLNTNL